MTRLMQMLRQREFQIFLCSLLFILINWPFLSISSTNGVTSIFIYLFVTWGLSIVLLFLIQLSLKAEASDDDDGNEGDF